MLNLTLPLAALTLILPAQDPKPVDPIEATGVINAPVAEVWKAWTTNEGIRTWMVVSGTVDLRVGGKFRTSYQKDSDLTGPDTIENTIISFDPQRMISLKNTKAPANFPWRKAMDNCWTVIYMEPTDSKHTKVVVRMLGYTEDPQSVEMRKFFLTGNQQTLDALAKKFK